MIQDNKLEKLREGIVERGEFLIQAYQAGVDDMITSEELLFYIDEYVDSLLRTVLSDPQYKIFIDTRELTKPEKLAILRVGCGAVISHEAIGLVDNTTKAARAKFKSIGRLMEETGMYGPVAQLLGINLKEV